MYFSSAPHFLKQSNYIWEHAYRYIFIFNYIVLASYCILLEKIPIYERGKLYPKVLKLKTFNNLIGPPHYKRLLFTRREIVLRFITLLTWSINTLEWKMLARDMLKSYYIYTGNQCIGVGTGWRAPLCFCKVRHSRTQNLFFACQDFW